MEGKRIALEAGQLKRLPGVLVVSVTMRDLGVTSTHRTIGHYHFADKNEFGGAKCMLL